MRVWVDADACPNMIKEVLFRAAQRRKVQVTLVANQPIKVIPSPFIKAIQVSAGFDVADNYIVEQVEAGDLIITADIPLAAEAIEKGGLVISPRGELLTAENIRPRLNMRDFLEQMRSSGEHTGGPAALTPNDKQAFANALDRLITKGLKDS
ncbi:YaiI/YqxD family protein [Saccharophagus degradans]|uniref:YaiI/YqxD family protein n=1 Tax=Saccharophagus degradans TaxID=86304 RepID=UPI001C0A0580|nr:YaiI/YqxD family protein [Saccharophagus degradans]MBU2985104.1 YaiI/YqxD family protein [Saccharophagus degradans]WGO99526.1 YaiI/YqxD family protein [Saccharophagus degradans]